MPDLIAPVQQQGNGSDCVVFAIAFATCLFNFIDLKDEAKFAILFKIRIY